MRIAIIGGGFAGLSAAHEILKRGHEVEIFERAPQLGGQVVTFPIGNTRLEYAYHHLFTSDTAIQELMDELGIGDQLEFLPSTVGWFEGGRVYPFVSPMDLLRFGPLRPWNRIRLGLVVLGLQRTKNWRRLEGTTAARWMRRWAGRNAYERVWRPLLRGKFGTRHEDVSMTWLWGKIALRTTSRKSLAKEELGYPKGSFQTIIDALDVSIRARGGGVHLGATVEAILTAPVEDGPNAQTTGNEAATEIDRAAAGGDTRRGEPVRTGPPIPPLGSTTPAELAPAAGAEDGRDPVPLRTVGLRVDGREERFDRVIATVPSPVFLRIAPPLGEEYERKLRAGQYQGAILVILVLRRRLTDTYWLNIGEEDMPFVALIEHTNFIPPEVYGGKRVLYISNYLSTDDPLWSLGQDALLDAYEPYLRRINPHFTRAWIEDVKFFREPSAQPIMTPGYSAHIPELRTPVAGLILANTTQIYPQDRGTNYSVLLGRRAAEAATED